MCVWDSYELFTKYFINKNLFLDSLNVLLHTHGRDIVEKISCLGSHSPNDLDLVVQGFVEPVHLTFPSLNLSGHIRTPTPSIIYIHKFFLSPFHFVLCLCLEPLFFKVKPNPIPVVIEDESILYR